MSEPGIGIKTEKTFDFTGGNLCLDFVNTVEGSRPLEPQRELLTHYDDLVTWGLQAHILHDQQASRLLARAECAPREATTVLERAILLREALFRIFLAVAEQTSPTANDLRIMNDALVIAMSHARIAEQGEEFLWTWPEIGEQLECVLWPVLRAAADLLTSDLRHTTRVCAAEDCQWLFLDTSKNHSRRWCDMKSCGNRAKARRFSERKRQHAQ
ncbi:MAG: ABATE domain-containing protein [Ktedonobacteraceae bacterium]|nr:ABATE domain-containing protein [Ktedonobacteraceae bacterium]